MGLMGPQGTQGSPGIDVSKILLKNLQVAQKSER